MSVPRVFLLSPANCGGTRAQAGDVAARDVRAGRAAAVARGRAARRGVQLRQRPVLPRQAGLRAAVRRAARAGQPGRRRRRPRHHAERRAAQPGHARDAAPPFARSRASTSIPTTRPTAGRSSRARGRWPGEIGPDVRRRAARQHRVAEVRRRAARRSSATGCCSRSIRRPRRHEPRRAAAAARADGRRARLRAGRRRRRHGARPPKLPPLAMADARRRLGSTGATAADRAMRAARPCAPVCVIPRDQDNVVLTVERQGSPAHQPPQAVLAGARAHQGRPAPVLRRRRGRAAAAPRDRAMVMKRYPHGAAGEFFFMKRAPTPRPAWIEICSIEHGSGNVIDFPMIQDRAALLWVINLGCIDLNQWYATLRRRRSARLPALRPRSRRRRDVRSRCARRRWSSARRSTRLKMPSLVKTTGSKGLHVYVPIVRGPMQKQVWTFAKALAQELAARHPALITAEYRVAKRPQGRVLVDYNQNAWGRTLASIYSVRPRPEATVSTPVTWNEVERGVRIEDFTHDNVPNADREGRRPVEAASSRAGGQPGLTLMTDLLRSCQCELQSLTWSRFALSLRAARRPASDPRRDRRRLDDHQHRHRQQHPPDAPEQAPEHQADEHRDRVHPRRAAGQPAASAAQPSSVVIAKATPAARSIAIGSSPNCRNATTADAAGDEHRAEVRDRVEHARQKSPERRLLEADPSEREPGRHPDDALVNSCTSRNRSICRLISRGSAP